MESNRLFVSKDGKHFVNIYLDVTIYEKNDCILIFKKQLSKIKNPDTACFSNNGKLIAVKNNNNLIEVYDSSSRLRILKGKAPRTFGGRMFFVDDTTLLSSTEDGMIYTFDILTGNVSYCFDRINLNYVELVEITPGKYFVLGNKKATSDTDIYSLSFDEQVATIELLHSTLSKLDTNSSNFIKNKLYAISKNNELFVFNYDIKSNSLIQEKIIPILKQSDVTEFTDHAFDIIREMVPDIDINLSASLFPVGITATSIDKYIIIAFNLGVVVFDVYEYKCIAKIPLKHGISSIATTDNGKYIWFSSSNGILCSSIENVIKGFQPNEAKIL